MTSRKRDKPAHTQLPTQHRVTKPAPKCVSKPAPKGRPSKAPVAANSRSGIASDSGIAGADIRRPVGANRQRLAFQPNIPKNRREYRAEDEFDEAEQAELDADPFADQPEDPKNNIGGFSSRSYSSNGREQDDDENEDEDDEDEDEDAEDEIEDERGNGDSGNEVESSQNGHTIQRLNHYEHGDERSFDPPRNKRLTTLQRFDNTAREYNQRTSSPSMGTNQTISRNPSSDFENFGGSNSLAESPERVQRKKYTRARKSEKRLRTSDSDDERGGRERKKKRRRGKKRSRRSHSDSDTDSSNSENDTEDNSSNDEADKPKKGRKSDDRPRRGDYGAKVREVLDAATLDLTARLITSNLFYDEETFKAEAIRAWERTEKTFKRYIKLDGRLLGVMSQNVTATKGRVKQYIRAHTSKLYKFDDSNKKAEENKERAQALLKEGNFTFGQHYPDEQKGMYRSKHIRTMINDLFFKDAQAIGVKYRSYFNPMPLEVVALVCTLMEFCIGQFVKTGIQQTSSFSWSASRPIFKVYLDSLYDWKASDIGSRIASDLQVKLYKSAMEKANAEDDKGTNAEAVPSKYYNEEYESEEENTV